jgi:hypothetical protein
MIRIRHVVLALSLGAAFAGCGSGSDDSSNETGGSGGSGGSGGGSQKNECSLTKCVDPIAIQDDTCRRLLADPCAEPFKAYRDCSLANDECLADGTQDGAKALKACLNQANAFADCTVMDGGSK